MTQIWEGTIAHPVTVIAIPENKVTQVKTVEKDGYAAVQVGYGARREKNVSKAQKAKGNFAGYREFRGATEASEPFAAGDVVTVSGISKGKGFQGVVKRYGFRGGPRSHGQKHSERERGSSGGGPGRAGGRVALGMRMAGRMGGDRVTVKNLSIIKVDDTKGELYIKGAIPGRRGSWIEIVSK